MSAQRDEIIPEDDLFQDAVYDDECHNGYATDDDDPTMQQGELGAQNSPNSAIDAGIAPDYAGTRPHCHADAVRAVGPEEPGLLPVSHLEGVAGYGDPDHTIRHEVPLKTILPGRQLCDKDPIIEPGMGMQFESRDEAFAFYNLYALRLGFATRRRTVYRFEGQPYKATFTCSRGRKPGSNSTAKCRPPPGFEQRKHGEHATECNARFVITDNMLNDCWEITDIELQHNHQLVPKSVGFFKCHRKLPEFVKSHLQINDRAGVPQKQSLKSVFAMAGGVDNCSFNERDCRNLVQAQRALHLVKGDANTLMHHFHLRQSQSQSYFYRTQFDAENRVSRIFWIHGRARTAYKYFGDVVTFDTTYLTNKYEMPFAPFVGINHHGQSTLLGCALLPDETTQTYVWVLQTWLEAMGGVPPKGIITDQCQAIGKAVKQVLPQSRHRLCLWHIAKKWASKCGHGEVGTDRLKRVRNLAHGSTSTDEFDSGWLQIIAEIPQKQTKLDYFQYMYKIRAMWVPVYLQGFFWAGMSTTQRSESINSFFDGFVNSSTTLTCFVQGYETAIRSRWHAETKSDFDDFKNQPKLISNHFFEKQFASAYTAMSFYTFQREVQQLLNLHSQLVYSDEHHSEFVVSESNRPPVSVLIFKATSMYTCPCQLLQFRGIVCRHALCAYRHIGIHKLPDALVLDRWRKDLIRSNTDEGQLTPITVRNLDSYDHLYKKSHAILMDLVHLYSPSPDMHDYMIGCLNALHVEARKLMHAREAEPVGEPDMDNPIEIAEDNYLEPVNVARSGRPSNKRLQSHWEQPNRRRRVNGPQTSNLDSEYNAANKQQASTSNYGQSNSSDDLSSLSHTSLLRKMNQMGTRL